jgi:hypothetical protein
MLHASFAQIRHAKSRSVSPENVYGEKGRGGMAEARPEPQSEVARNPAKDRLVV